MKVIWLNDGEPDEHGEYIAVIENAAGVRVSTFKGKNYKEVADRALDSMANANREISRLRKPDQGRTPFRAETKQLTPDDRFRLSNAITEPSTVVEAVTEIMTAQGAPPQQVGQKVSELDRKESDAYYFEQARKFAMTTPEYYPVPQNRDALFEELTANNYAVTANNMSIAWQTLIERGDTVPWPSEEEKETFQYQLRHPDEENKPNGKTAAAKPTAEPNTPSPRPRSIATGIRNTDASASPPPPPRKKAVTRADIERMSRTEFVQRLQLDPDFRRQVDAMGA